jgi:hypothetical protein
MKENDLPSSKNIEELVVDTLLKDPSMGFKLFYDLYYTKLIAYATYKTNAPHADVEEIVGDAMYKYLKYISKLPKELTPDNNKTYHGLVMAKVMVRNAISEFYRNRGFGKLTNETVPCSSINEYTIDTIIAKESIDSFHISNNSEDLRHILFGDSASTLQTSSGHREYLPVPTCGKIKDQPMWIVFTMRYNGFTYNDIALTLGFELDKVKFLKKKAITFLTKRKEIEQNL